MGWKRLGLMLAGWFGVMGIWTMTSLAEAAVPVLAVGSQGSAVASLQQDLDSLGYAAGAVDGVFGPQTLAAVEQFQRDQQLAVDGVVGPATWQALATASGQNIPNSNEGPGSQDDSRTGFVNLWTHEPPLADDGQNVVLTFDDGPSPWTADLIRTLQQEGVPAVFFWNTYHIQYANDEVKQLLSDDSDIQVGDHTVDHPDLIHLGYDQQYAEIADAKRLIEQTTGQPVRFFRPPYGDYNATTEHILHDLGLTGVMWDVDTLDWKYNDHEQPILDTIRREVHPGSIILMHDHPYTIRFLPDIIAELRQLGYGFTTLTVPQAHAALVDPPPGRVRYI